MSKYHRLGACSCRYAYGLYVKRTTGCRETSFPAGELVAVATFSNARRMNDGSRSYEWIRYASCSGVRVVGGMGKLLETFVCDIHPDDVVSYCDIDSPDGGGAYTRLGFEYEGVVEKPSFKCKKFRKTL